MTAQRRREPARGVFRLVLPLDLPGMTNVNAYLLANGDRFTLVDCGIHDPAAIGDHGWSDLVAAIESSGMALDAIERLVVTHTHVDHYGMAARLVDKTGCELWLHADASSELDAYRDPAASAGRVRAMLEDHGVSAVDELSVFEDWRPFVSGVVEPTTPVRGGERFWAGDREWEVVHTPGHARSHVCLWASGDRLLVSGDHLLPTITPHIDFRRGADEDPLGEFLQSLTKVEELDPALVLPGHGRPFEEGAERARVVARHHDRRLGAILQVIRREAHTASEITDEIFGTTLLNFERRLALGETLAHLAYLRRRGEVERMEEPDGTFSYKKAERRRSSDDPSDAR